MYLFILRILRYLEVCSHFAPCLSRTPSILNKDPADKKPKNEKSSVSLKHEFDPTGKRHADLFLFGGFFK